MLEHFTYAQSSLRWCLKETESMLLRQSSASLTIHNFVSPIALVRYQYLSHIRAGMLIYLLQPILNVIEGLLLSTVIHQYYTHRSLIICLSDRSESLLSCCVPNLQFNSFVIHIDCFYLEINTYSNIVCQFIRDLPIVGMWLTGKLSSEKRRRMQVLPTLESPMIISFKRWS